ncbi:E3 ubiquitin-protein ligase TRIM47 [Etheostoma spectabile]|uniref:E3 ubiquitin-protein ligase TRIM47 n=1 Tax=Etheostoma spectabile TaxID=54343 RepID=UPI0013AE9975|nr:E3 ubiquitin-protein ligase TRIM47-like [Etheostoma spectabile]
MAELQQQEHGVQLDQNQFCCSVCLEQLREPVTIPCGHSYCKGCIEGCWEHKEKKGEVSCPQCRETFSTRPVLQRNTMLAELVEQLKSSLQQASPPAAEACAGPADVACDFCSGTGPFKATMSCLTCLVSYCPAHLEPHHRVPALKNHQLVPATIPLQEKLCRKHNKLIEIYCQTDKKCICYLCVIDEHKRHCTVSAAAERAVEQKQLTVTQKKVQERQKERENELNELLQALMEFKSGSQPAIKICDEIFDELICSIKKKHTLVKQLIEAQEHAAVSQAEELQLQLKEEITKLKIRDTDLEQLSHTNDHVHFIQTFQSLSSSCESPDGPTGPVVHPQHLTFHPVTDSMSKLRDDIEGLLKDTSHRISATVSTIDVVLPPVPKTREEFLRYCHPLSLDETSLSQYLFISQEHRRVMFNYKYHMTPPRNSSQVLCREGLSERCYWEVSLSGYTWSVVVSYKDVCRSSSHESEFGNNNKSWSLECSRAGYTFQHNSKGTPVSGPPSSKIGVFLDYKPGTLSFYNVSDSMTLLHEEHTTFTQPLYPALGLKQGNDGHYAELIKLW